MKKFGGMKNIEELKEDAILGGWELDFTEWDNKGSDCTIKSRE